VVEKAGLRMGGATPVGYCASEEKSMAKRQAARIFTAFIFFTAAINTASASENERTCHGNIETFNQQIIQAGVMYKLSYTISGAKASVRFAGREFDALAESGKSWKGVWIKRMDENIYFSFLPDEGGTIKFQFKPTRWYSGNC
jgi:hypothetical protein